MLRATVIGFVVLVIGGAFLVMLQASPRLRIPSKEAFAARAADPHVIVADVPLVFPFAALPEYVSMGQVFTFDYDADKRDFIERAKAFRLASSNPATAPRLDVIAVWTLGYSKNGFEGACPLMSREWARNLCSDSTASLSYALPDRFHLVDDARIDVFDSHWGQNSQRISDLLRAMGVFTDQTRVSCGVSTRYGQTCIAALRLDRRLIAVWHVWTNPESAEQQGAREGLAIAAFYRHALGPVEDFEQLTALTCKLRRPGFFSHADRAWNPCGDTDLPHAPP